MKSKLFIISICLCAFMLAMASAIVAQPAPDVVPDRYIVQVKSDATPAKVAGSHKLVPAHVYTTAVKGFAGTIPPGQMKALQADPAVVSIVPDRIVRAFGKPSKPATPAPQQVPAGVIRIGASPTNSSLTGEGVGVAVVDTGLDFEHQDLNVAEQYFGLYGTSARDANGHGTHVGGTIAAKNNAIDVVGVAPDATLYAVRVLDARGEGYDSDIIAGIDWIKANAAILPVPIRVVNMSLGRTGTLNDSPTLREAIRSLYNVGIVVVVSAGNDSSLEISQIVPAGYPEVFAVASTTAKSGVSKLRGYPAIAADTASYFTTDGAGITISAPGEDQEDISRAGFIGSVGILSTKLGGGTTRMSGTSMAAPHVAGVVARYVQGDTKFGDAASVEAIRALIRGNADLYETAPLASPTSAYTYDGEREGVVLVPEKW